ncbi:DUF1648 domain-containing protein [Dietzia sp.]|uniref:DUF1648 domain-containing protein n=1 Tax=Dietzia sp. TaxID=1871616 RepID=UPI002FDAC349
MSTSTDRQPLLRGPLRHATAVATCTIPLLLSCVYAACAFVWRDRPPTEMATHFSGGGNPDDWSSRTSTLWTFTAIVVLLLAVPLTLTLAGIVRGAAGRLLAAVLSGAAGATGTVSILVLYVQLDGKDPSLGWVPMLLVAAAAIVCGAVAALTFPARAT